MEWWRARAEDLRASAVLGDGRRLSVAVFPGYGALASGLAPAGATEIRVHAEPPRLPWAPAWAALGLACCAGAAVLGGRVGIAESDRIRAPQRRGA